MRIVLPSGTPAEIQKVDVATRGLVIFPDIFGLRPLFDEHVQRFAREWGCTTIAVEPFPNLAPEASIEDRFAATPGLNDSDTLRDINEAADATGCANVSMIGFCMGGMYCFKSVSLRRFDRIASFYGMITLPDHFKGAGQGEPLELMARGDASKLLAVIGGRDPWTPEADVELLRATGATVAFYPDADHGFSHDASRPTHRADDAADAFAKAKNWLLMG